MTVGNTTKYNPQRIQTLDSEQEVLFKQTWAYILKYFGYPLSINNSDIAYTKSFISSTSTQNFDESRVKVPFVTLQPQSSKPDDGKHKGRHHDRTHDSLPPNSERKLYIENQSNWEQYVPLEVPSDEYYYIFTHHLNANFEKSHEYSELIDKFGLDTPSNENSDTEIAPNDAELFDNNDCESISSFVTAVTSFSQYKTVSPDILKSVNKETLFIPNNETKQNVIVNNTRILPDNFKVKITPCLSLHHCFQLYSPQDVHNGLFAAIRNGLVDNFVLRYVRARKWDVEKAITMFVKSIDWRANVARPEDLGNEGDAPSYLSGTNKLFIKGLTREKIWIGGKSRNNNIVVVVSVKQQLISESNSAQNLKYFVTIIEWVRLFLKDVSASEDKITLLFDCTGISLKNADYQSIKFLANIFEAHYPEVLEFVLVHSAPWIAYKIYEVAKPWVDPCIISKFYFTKNFDDLARFIDPIYLPSCLGGQSENKSTYPIPTENDLVPPKSKDKEYVYLKKERDLLFLRFLETTRKWIEATNSEVSELYLQDKVNISKQLNKNYTKLDPYVRLKGVFDRNGELTVSD